MSNIGRSGQARARPSITDDNVPPRIYLGIEMSIKLLELTTAV